MFLKRNSGSVAVRGIACRNYLLDLLIRDEATGETAWANDYDVSAVPAPFSFEMKLQITGRYYHSAHGYVDLDTGTPLQIDHNEDWPFGGTLIVLGEDNGYVRLVFNIDGYCLLRADFDGDGIFDMEDEHWFD